MAMVKTLVAFSSAHVGSREVGETFDYDVDKDPAGVLAEGKVAKVPAKKAAAAGAGEGGEAGQGSGAQ